MIPVYRNVDSPNGDFGLTRQEGDEEFVVLTKAEYAALCPVTSPGAHGEGEAVNLWRNDWKHSPMPWVGVKWETCDRPAGSTEYRALPVDAYNALLARANTAKVLLKEARPYMKRLPFDLAKRLDDAMGEG